ncbi:MAG: NAD-dependent epimerase/dehydratase family protein [Anaerolineae bacterium]
MRYFLTGATGFIGGNVAAQLRAAGHDVVAVVRDPERATALRALGVALHRGDVTDKESMRQAMAGADGVFHIAGWYKVGARDKRPGMRVNVEGTRNTLELMRDLGIPRGVYTSTVAVFSDTHGCMVDESYRYEGPHLSEYDRTKWLAHYQVAEPLIRQGLPLTIVLPGAVYGPGDNSSLGQSFEWFLQRRLPLVPVNTRLCWAHVEDIARGHILAMEKGRPGESYIIAGEPHTLIDAYAIASRLTGIPAPRLHLPPWGMRGLAGVMAAIGAVVPLPPAFAAESLREAAGVTYLGSNAKARRELGYSTRSLQQGLAETLPAMAARLGVKLPR